ncbi:hypothetical protein [Metapseudomonas resinovorans]|nr:hypothetical protein [Pseudomonas resinovorans]
MRHDPLPALPKWSTISTAILCRLVVLLINNQRSLGERQENRY